MKMPITRLDGLGCSNCKEDYASSIQWRSLGRLGALGITREEVYNFFVGPKKWTMSNDPTNVYKNPGESPIRVIPPQTEFKIVDINQGLNFGKLSTGEWVFLSSKMYTVILTVEPPTSAGDAVLREVEKVYEQIPFLPSLATLQTALWVVAGVGVIILISKANEAGLIPKKKPALAGVKKRKPKK
jgi:hypothetical protein